MAAKTALTSGSPSQDPSQDGSHSPLTPEAYQSEDPTGSTVGLAHRIPHAGTVIPNCIFVGQICPKVRETELWQAFCKYGSIQEVKIVFDKLRKPKGYGFVTFETEEEAKRALEVKKTFLKDKWLTIAPAVHQSHVSEGTNAPVLRRDPVSSDVLYLRTPTGCPYTYCNGVAYFQSSNVNPPSHHWPSVHQVTRPLLVHHQPFYDQYSVVYSQPSEYLQQSADGGSAQPMMPVMENATSQIIFYEDRNFQGRHHECMSDCADLHPYFNRCNSIRVESGCFMVYERPHYLGHQYFLRRGEYSDNQRMIGINDCIRSCRMIPMHRGSYKIRLYERPDMAGQMQEVSDDCPNVQDRLRMSDINSCNVVDGHWLLYDQPNYRGRTYYLRPGEYRRYSDWGGASPRIGSLRRITDFN